MDKDDLMSFEDFAKKHGKSLSTIQRWARQGKVEVVSKDGKRYIQIQARIEPVSPKEKVSQETSIPLLVNNKLLEEVLSKVTEMGIDATRAKSKWVVVSTILLILFILSVVTGTAVGIWYYRVNTSHADMNVFLRAHNDKLVDQNRAIAGELTNLNSQISELQSQLKLKDESEQYKAQLSQMQIANAKLREDLAQAEKTILNNKKNYQETVAKLTKLLENSGSSAFIKLGEDK